MQSWLFTFHAMFDWKCVVCQKETFPKYNEEIKSTDKAARIKVHDRFVSVCKHCAGLISSKQIVLDKDLKIIKQPK